MNESVKIEVHLKDKVFMINCGDGAQRIKWLGDIAITRYDSSFGMITGPPKGVRLENGALLPMDGVISQNLENESKVWILINDELDALQDKKKGKPSSGQLRRTLRK